MDTKYFEKNEENDLKLFNDFNTKTKLFGKIQPTHKYGQYDATAIAKKRTFAVELKSRNMKIDAFKTIMIEDYKYLELLLAKQFENKEPLYINFLNNDTVVLFNMDKLKNKPQFKENVDIESKGYGTKQKERRYYIDLKEAVVYKNGKRLTNII